MKAIVYSGPGWGWCERVKYLLEQNKYEVEEIKLTGNIVNEFNEKFDTQLRSIPQVVIDDKLIGGFSETESYIKGPLSINRV